jgi:hypothetical protein
MFSQHAFLVQPVDHTFFRDVWLTYIGFGKSCCLPSIRNAQATVSELAAFVGRSAGQTHLLKEVIRESTAVDTKRQKLQSLCETRWVERHDAVVFL